MNYAKQTSNQLFIESGLRDSWWDYLNSASDIQEELECRFGAIREQQVLFEREGVRWDTPPRRQAGEEVASFTPGGIGEYREGVGTLRENGGDIGGGSENLVTATLRGFGHGWQGQHNDTNAVIAYNIQEDKSPCLNLNHEQPIVWQFHGQDADARMQKDTTPSVANTWGAGGNNMPMVGVRRLTPVECERLQGFPDSWTSAFADSTRYRMLGNAVTVNVAEWIGKRLAGVQVELG